jgi:hypothetical protein
VSSIGGGASATSTAGATGAATAGVDPIGSTTSGASAAGQLDPSFDLPDQPAPPSVSAESEVSQAAGQEGSAVLRGGGAGVVEREMGGAAGAGLEQEGVAAGRGARGDVRGTQFAAGEASFSATTAPTSGLGRAENLEFHQRDQVVARSQAAEDAHSEARRVVDDPAAVGTEQAEMKASQKAGEAMPVDPRRAEAQAATVTGAVENPRGAAQAKAEGTVSIHEREAEAKIGIRGSDGRSREEIVGSPPTGDDEKG